MPSFALAAIGADRPGLVAAVADVLFEHGCNVEDSTMTLLRGNFSVMLVLAAPDGTDRGSLEESLRDACGPLGMTVALLDVKDTESDHSPSHVVTVYGADKPGILQGITRAIAEVSGNITDLTSRLLASGSTPVYALMLEVKVADEATFSAAVTAAAAALGTDVSIREYDDDAL